jgi:hypothetical protein
MNEALFPRVVRHCGEIGALPPLSEISFQIIPPGVGETSPTNPPAQG